MSDTSTCSYSLLKRYPQIDRLNLEGYANLDHWVAELDKKIEGILLQRLKHVAQVWCTEFDRSADDGELRRDPVPSKRRDKQRGEKVSAILLQLITTVECGAHEIQFLEGSMTLKPIVHEIRIQNQVIFLDPPIESARQTWLQQLHDWLGKYQPLTTRSARYS
jgi:hypothetical protein